MTADGDKWEKLYYDPIFPGSYSGRNKFAKGLSRNNLKPKTKELKQWLQKEDSYTLHKPVRWRFRRRRTYAAHIDYLWQIDLSDMSKLSRSNDGNKYILFVIDVLSKFAWAAVLKNKSGLSVQQALSRIMQKRKPIYVQSDKGGEFLNNHVQRFLKEKGIKFYTSNNDDVKAAVVERFQRTLKGRMWRYFTKHNTRRYVDVLQALIKSYNKTYHRSIRMSPEEVNDSNQTKAWSTLYRKHALKRTPHKFVVGDKVRISKSAFVFRKGFLPSWTLEIFTISTRLATDPPTYTLKDYSGEDIEGCFYEPELNLVKKSNDLYTIEKLLRKKKIDGKTYYFVKWLGYPRKFNSYVAEQDIHDML